MSTCLPHMWTWLLTLRSNLQTLTLKKKYINIIFIIIIDKISDNFKTHLRKRKKAFYHFWSITFCEQNLFFRGIHLYFFKLTFLFVDPNKTTKVSNSRPFLDVTQNPLQCCISVLKLSELVFNLSKCMFTQSPVASQTVPLSYSTPFLPLKWLKTLEMVPQLQKVTQCYSPSMTATYTKVMMSPAVQSKNVYTQNGLNLCSWSLQ